MRGWSAEDGFSFHWPWKGEVWLASQTRYSFFFFFLSFFCFLFLFFFLFFFDFKFFSAKWLKKWDSREFVLLSDGRLAYRRADVCSFSFNDYELFL